MNGHVPSVSGSSMLLMRYITDIAMCVINTCVCMYIYVCVLFSTCMCTVVTA